MRNVARKVSSKRKNARKLLLQLLEDYSELLAERQAFFQTNTSDSSSSDSSSSFEDNEDTGNGSHCAAVQFPDGDDIASENTGPSVDMEDF